jgi:hypothetical protein
MCGTARSVATGKRRPYGTLASIAGRDPAVLDRCLPVPGSKGTIHHRGPVGMGMVVKPPTTRSVPVGLVLEVRAFALDFMFGAGA